MKNRLLDYIPATNTRSHNERSLPDIEQFTKPIEKYVIANPATSLAIAAMVGVALAIWIKRK
jgi:ElaB/YqjD/DUF883 family membrane-anchored ribosome-binding protein